MATLFKQKVYSTCLQQLESKIKHLQNDLRELKEGAENDSKSSAGDKHETGRAMMQIEYEKTGRLLDDLQRQKSELEKIDIGLISGKIKNGSLVKTSNGYLFLGAAAGKIIADNIPVMTITLLSPIGQKLHGLKEGDRCEMNGLVYTVETIE